MSDVCLTPKSGHLQRVLFTSALCQKQTFSIRNVDACFNFEVVDWVFRDGFPKLTGDILAYRDEFARRGIILLAINGGKP